MGWMICFGDVLGVTSVVGRCEPKRGFNADVFGVGVKRLQPAFVAIQVQAALGRRRYGGSEQG